MPLYQPNDIILNGKYKIEKLLGAGAFGEVYLVTHLDLGVQRAVKVAHRNMPGFASSRFEEAFDRFRQEAQIGARLKHENLIQVFDFYDGEDSLHLVMEYATGGSLEDRIQSKQKQEEQFSVEETLQILIDVSSGLAVLHDKRNPIVHRDLKPSNILFDENGKAKIADLGLAQVPANLTQRSRLGSLALSHPGTPAYMSPEQESSAAMLRQTSDIYTLGVIAFEILTGVNYNMVRPGTRLTEYRTDVEKEVNNLISEMLQEEPRKRPWDGGELLVRLQKLDHARKVEKDRQAEQKRREEEQRQERERREREEDELRKEQAVRQKQEEEARRSWLEKEEKEPAKQPENRTEVNNKAEQSSPYLPKSEPKWKAIFSDKRRNYFMVGVMIVGIIWILVANNPPKTGISTPIAAIGQETTVSSNQETKIESTNTPTNTVAVQLSATKIITKTITPTKDQALGIGSTKISEKDGTEMVYVPAGSFLMGSESSDAYSDEGPEHEVYLDGYWIDKYEVTNRQYAQCVAVGNCTTPANTSSNTRGSYYSNATYDDYPVIYVSWYDAQDYCHWAGRELPTEAQWEKATRGTDDRIYPWGNEPPNSTLSNYYGIKGDTTAVGSYPKGVSPYGAMDMAGNVWEWVKDWYSVGYYSVSPANNPPGPTTGEYKVIRGGGVNKSAGSLRTAYRSHNNPDNRNGGDIGFRCVLSP